jgi:CRP-like cAMP-binding protein
MRGALLEMTERSFINEKIITVGGSDAPHAISLNRPGMVLVLVDGSPALLREKAAHSSRVPLGTVLVSAGSDAQLAGFPQMLTEDCLMVGREERPATFLLLTEAEFMGLRGFSAVLPRDQALLHLLLAFPEMRGGRNLTLEQLQDLAGAFVPRQLNQGSRLVMQGQARDQKMWLIHGGLVDVARREGRDIAWTAYFGPGEGVGENAFLGAEERSADVLAVENLSVLELDAASSQYGELPNLVKQAFESGLQRIRDERARRGGRLGQAAPALLKLARQYGIPFTSKQAQFVSGLLKPCMFPEGAVLIRKDEIVPGGGAPLFVIECGEVLVDRGGRQERIVLKLGDIVGELGFSERGRKPGAKLKRTATVSARTPVIALQLNPTYKPLIQQHAPNFLALLDRMAQNRQLLV